MHEESSVCTGLNQTISCGILYRIKYCKGDCREEGIQCRHRNARVLLFLELTLLQVCLFATVGVALEFLEPTVV
jgi:hypothetical protein